MFPGNSGDDPISWLYRELAFWGVDEANDVIGGSCDDNRMISVVEPLHGFYDHGLFQESSHPFLSCRVRRVFAMGRGQTNGLCLEWVESESREPTIH
jgi:hypothetical protein